MSKFFWLRIPWKGKKWCISDYHNWINYLNCMIQFFIKYKKFGQFSCGKVWSEYVCSPFYMYSMNLRIIWNNCLIVSPQITCHKRYNTTCENERCVDKKSFTNIKPCSTSHVILMWWIWACTVFPHQWISKSFRWCWKGWTWTFF